MAKTRPSQEEWKRVEEVYHEALEHRPESRAAFVTAACGADSSLRREVESLLAADGAHALVDQPAMDIAAELLDDGAPLAPGTELGPYRIESLIGSGGMGRVYRARDTRLNRTVALKISKQGFGERFEREARAVAALNHAHICQLYDIGPNYLVMEFVEGTPLKGPLPLAKAVEYAGEILDALDAAHRKSVVHRDLKPANILVSKQGVKLLDFGLAKQVAPVGSDATVTKGLTVAGSILGTVQYMSPEQLQGKPVDARGDLFSFGCVLYELLTGKRAFEGENPASVIAAVLEREPAPLEISPPLDRVVENCLAKDPDQRFQNAIDLKRALKWALEQTPVAKSATRRWWIGGIAAAVLALGLVGGWMVSRIGKPAAEERQLLHFKITLPKGSAASFGSRAGLSASPDGRFATYSASVNGKTALWLHPLNGSADHLLVDNAEAFNAQSVFWSPDGKSVGWVAQQGTIWRRDLSGGTPAALYRPALNGAPFWTADGRILFGGQEGLMQISESGGTPTRLTKVDASLGEVAHRAPYLIPGGPLLYFAENAKSENSAIYAAPLSNLSKRVLVTRSPGLPLYAHGGNGRDYLLTVSEEGLVAREFDIQELTLGPPHTVVSQFRSLGLEPPAAVSSGGLLLYSGGLKASRFMWIDRAGKNLEVLGEPDRYHNFRLSPDGKRFIAVRERASPADADLWLMDVERHTFSLFAQTLANQAAVWSNDGRTVLFTDQGSLIRSVFRKGISDSGQGERIGQWPVYRLCDWSRDGRSLLYELSSPGTGRDLWVASMTPDGRLAEGSQPKPYLNGPSAEWQGRFSPEPSPRWVAYQSDETGRSEVYIASFPDARRKLQVTSGGGTFPRWGPDGRELFYLSADGMLSVVGLRKGADGLEPSSPQQLFPMAADSQVISPYEVSPDGKRILVNQAQPNTELDVVVNWPLLLRGQAAQ